MSIVDRWRSLLVVVTTVSAAIIFGAAAGAAASQSADIAIGLTATPSGIFTRTVTLTVTVTNNGPDASERSSVGSAIFPQDLSLALPSGCQLESFWVTCTAGALQPGASSQFSIKASGTGYGTWETQPITFRLIGGIPADPNPNNNSASVTCTFGGSLFLIC